MTVQTLTAKKKVAQKEQEREIRRCKKTGNDRSDDDEPESRSSGCSLGRATVKLEMGRVQERRPDSPFLLALLQSHTVAIMAAVVCRLASRTIKR
jgi:hypothetical protein